MPSAGPSAASGDMPSGGTVLNLLEGDNCMNWNDIGRLKSAILEKRRPPSGLAQSVPVFILYRQLSMQTEVLTSTADVAFVLAKAKRGGSQSPDRTTSALFHALPQTPDRWVQYLSKPKAKAAKPSTR